ncbi:alpha/beta fold hydrolase [Pseudorhodoplanes sinuspersici]|uniref:Alpha/beta hydrolase n=1 Tax=Pseudorhodoplanes sinuspersici TaxID=1235591 RepID=A0A1W6ZS04_9HYPH|nr:alpha/beta hydrolase [Pseudorhodoplanes sinuspersici]ARQ00103.1 alpha/beta hydrolase [Pseudorhodoplanes sinuspersici]RKE71144.1 N-formylmaleamate deformylase [Pseudorhodoplanes sinuspersici]
MNQTSASGFLYGANVRANGIRQHYLRFGGKGPALIIVPGITTVAAQWAFVAERLCETFDMYVLDVRGRGLSESGAHLDYAIDACAADIVEFATAVGLKTFTLLGHSMGARIGIRAARHHASAFDQLVLVDPPVSGPGRRAYPIPLEPLLTLVRAAKRGEADVALRGPNAPKWPEAHIRTRAEWLHTCDERAIVETHRGFHHDDIHADLPHLTMPTALIAAGKGGVILSEDEVEIRQLSPSMAIKRLESAGHQMQIDDPEGFFSILASLFNSESLFSSESRRRPIGHH